ncbi:MAG: acetyl-CoA carboxylase biotin carboxylase subunit [Candidatus Cardinium sp.]|uniref:acetyl-CoA carboxylase biotin carboxylase subunit n=1 Tax=Candidatus Cardinium sp. TP TaxID=2961955 RepID=UPI0021AFECCE|nr:acetyl-CoA carboxylase biotin carboxylase subunit [Candidatus Cardinium sp. TP]MCT4697134.1 acetyl-CoA carboxylase biotin carboxylase subunit [Candidatus Cardinium sp. TP]MDN5247127.1 acetyl-CoA carboxylase biotin carboxylase subunit [Candidatus Cardinium sp.]
MFQKILIANRGEIALSIIRVCKEMGIKTVAVHSTADRDSLHVRFADESVCVGPPASHLSYLSIPSIIAAAEVTDAHAIHPGYGFLSENAGFSSICAEYGIKFIGPSAEAIRKMGDKSTAKATMQAAGVPIVPGSNGLLTSVEEGIRLAHEIGFPVLLKATAGGGGKGIKLVETPEAFHQKWIEARQEAIASFGKDGLYLEKYIEEPRHIEIQIVADQYGQVIHLSERDCSIQRRHQKLVEESPSPFVTAPLRAKITEAALKGVAAIGYEGVGTMEFLVDKHHNFYFMEMNTRIQVEYLVTEAVTGFNLLRTQIEIAAGKRLDSPNLYPQGHAIELRINAEDPFHGFRPAPGKINHVHFPGGLGTTIASHIYAGYVVPAHYDSMIAKLIVHAATRADAIASIKRALEEFVIEGIPTNIPFHRALVEDEAFQKGQFTTQYLDTFDFSLLKQGE